MDFILHNQAAFRLAIFAVLLALFCCMESLWARKERTQPRPHRWSTNVLLSVSGTILVRVLLPISAVETAIYSEKMTWGLLNQVDLSPAVAFLATIALLDLLIYLQHRAFHHIPVLWAIHKVHHADRDIDTSTGIRFHPIEIVLSMAFKCFCVALLGLPWLAVLFFEILLNGSSLFNHANLRLDAKVENTLRYFIVTPDMHRVHHSISDTEVNQNFGFFFSIWDRFFRSYTAQPKLGHKNMTIGLESYQHDLPSVFLWSLSLPFKSWLSAFRKQSD